MTNESRLERFNFFRLVVQKLLNEGSIDVTITGKTFILNEKFTMKNWLFIVLERSNVWINMQGIDIPWKSINESLVRIAYSFQNFVWISFWYRCQSLSGTFPLEAKASHTSDDNWHIVDEGELLFSILVFQIRVDSDDTKSIFALVDGINNLLLMNVLFSRLKFWLN